MAQNLEEFSADELTLLERRKLRRMLKENDNAHFLWAFLMKWVIIAAALAGFAATVKSWLSTWVVFK